MQRLKPVVVSLVLLASTNMACTNTIPESTDPQGDFFAQLSAHCGKAYAGKLASSDEVDADFRNAEMIMHLAQCSDQRIAIPFHVKMADGTWNRSRTWIITRQDNRLELRHRHRHEDGSDDPVTNYGGYARTIGTPESQAFPADKTSIAMFKANGLDASVENIWVVSLNLQNFSYELFRTNRHFRALFDITSPVATPPPPWGGNTVSTQPGAPAT